MNPHDEQLEKLLDAYFEGNLDATSREDLDQLITSSGDARKKFWDRAGIEGSLESWAARSRGESMAIPAPAARLPTAWKRHLPAISGWAAAAALLVAWLVQTHPAAKSPAPPASDSASLPPPVVTVTHETPVAYLSRVNGLAADSHMRPGQSLVAGREVTLREGLLELDFYSGARVSIQGPARFVPESDMRLTVAEGSVQVDVPDSAKGFKLVLPDGTVTDFGTSFGVVVTKEKTSRLQVSRGEIELAGTKDGGAAKRIFQGQAFSLAETNGSKPIAFHPMAVEASLESNSAADDRRRAAGWDELCAALATDPSLLVHFRFLPDEEGSREILNRSSAPNTPRTGTVIAAEWSRGRWEGKPALAFHNPADRVRVDIPGEYPQATFLAWVKVDSLPRRYNGLFLSEFGIPGETHWQVSPDGRFWFGVRPEVERPDWSFHRAFSEPVIFPSDFGTWRLLATSYDARTREVIHYVDGAEVHRSVIENSVPLRFGRATLGNFFDPAPADHVKQPGLGEEWSFRNWSGAIDEFMLFSRVLDKTEIARVHEAGRVN